MSRQLGLKFAIVVRCVTVIANVVISIRRISTIDAARIARCVNAADIGPTPSAAGWAHWHRAWYTGVARTRIP